MTKGNQRRGDVSCDVREGFGGAGWVETRRGEEGEGALVAEGGGGMGGYESIRTIKFEVPLKSLIKGKKRNLCKRLTYRGYLVLGPGFEPGTNRLKVYCSTD